MFGLLLLFVIIPIWVPTILEGNYGLRAKDMPIVAAVTITALAGAFFIYRLRSAELAEESSPPMTRLNGMFLLRTGLFLIVVVAIFEFLGFLYAGPVTITGFMIMMGERRILHVGGTALCVPVAIWLFFWQLLKFPLP